MRPAAAAVAALAALVWAAAAGAQRNEDLERLRAAIAESRARVASYEREERGLLEAVEALDRSAELLRAEAARAGRAARDAEAALARAEESARDAEQRLGELESAMATRAAALYRAGEVGTVSLLFAADGLRDFFGRVQTLRRLLRHDSDLISEHREQTRALSNARRQAAEASAAAVAATEQLGQRTRELGEERARKRALARRLGRSRSLARGALNELEIAARALEETLVAWRDDAAPAPVEPLPEAPPFESLRGRLERPVRGELRGSFGRVVDRDSLTATFRKGVAWEAPAGTPVLAVAAGRVRYAGRFRGYGNVVILDHGDDYFTVSAHLDEIGVGTGDPVAEGGEIGEVGETGSLDGPRLYFEVRRGGEALDPAEWLAAPASAARDTRSR